MLKVFSPSDKIYTTNGDCALQPLKAKVHKENNENYFFKLHSKAHLTVRFLFKEKEIKKCVN